MAISHLQLSYDVRRKIRGDSKGSVPLHGLRGRTDLCRTLLFLHTSTRLVTQHCNQLETYMGYSMMQHIPVHKQAACTSKPKHRLLLNTLYY